MSSDDLKDQAMKASTATFLTALAFNGAIFAIEIVVFTFLRPRFKATYEPRTYVPVPEKRSKPLSSTMFGWLPALIQADYKRIKHVNGLDAFFYVRFLRAMAKAFFPIWIVSWAVLLPLTSVNTGVEGNEGLNLFIFGNVGPDDQARYAGHIVLVYLFTFWIFYVIHGEMRLFIKTRHEHLIERTHAKSVQANTILVTGIPARYLTQDALFKLFNTLPGGVKKIWINRNLKDLPDIYDRRMAACDKLEGAEAALMRTSAKHFLKSSKANPDVERNNVAVPDSDRPTHKLGFLGLFGEKVDSINWARKEIAECTALLEEARKKIDASDERGSSEPAVDLDDDESFEDASEDGTTDGPDSGEGPSSPFKLMKPSEVTAHAKGAVKDVAKGAASGVAKGAGAIKQRVGAGGGGEYPPMNSAFITFGKQIGAHLAVQVLAHHLPYRMSQRYIEVSPDDVIWGNLNLNPYEQKVRLAISYAATAALIIFWAIPVAFVGAVSNISNVCTTAKWLAWICKLPEPVVGIISGILPPVALAVLMMLLPIVLRLFARFEGIPKYTGLELSLMSRFFIFQVVHSFLIVSLSAGILASLEDLINNPTSIPTILAQNLPKASTFFLTYILLQGLSGTAGGFLQIVGLIVYYVKLILLGSTPRSVWRIKYGLGSVAWGTLFPLTTLIVVITLGYSIISPIINGLAFATFCLFYLLYKYLFLYVLGQPATTDTGGLFYPKAIQHVFVGLYLQQVVLAALFFLARNGSGKASAIPEGALMIVLIIFTAGYNIILNNSYDPLLTALPLSLQDKTYSPPAIKEDEADSPAESSPPPTEDINAPAAIKPSKSGQEAEASYGFAHPAASRPQRTVWIPKDEMGVWEGEVEECNAAGVKVGVEGAEMDGKGKIDIVRGPPDLIGEVA